MLERFNEAQNCKLTRNLSTENEQKCFKTLRIMLKRVSGQNFELLYRIKFLFFYFLFLSRFFPLIASFSLLAVRGCNNLYSWGLFLKGTGTIYLPRFLPPFYMLIWSWFDRGWLWSFKEKRKKWNLMRRQRRFEHRLAFIKNFLGLAHQLNPPLPPGEIFQLIWGYEF